MDHIIYKINILSIKFNIDHDIRNLIYKIIINTAQEKIVKNWYNFISIHNTNLAYLISKLTVKRHNLSLLPYQEISYYDLTDKNVQISFNICYKYFSKKICDKTWWLEKLRYGICGLWVINESNLTDDIMNTYNNIQDIMFELEV